MKKNMGRTDSRMRTIAALIILLLYFFKLISGTLAIILLVLAVVFLITSAFQYCPLYSWLGVSSLRKKGRAH